MTKFEFDDDFEAFAFHELMERVRSYLIAGRAHANLKDYELLGQWESSYWSFMVYPSPRNTARFEAFDAERELRNLKAPTVRFSPRDRARIHRNIREVAANPQVRAQIAADYEEFCRQWHQPGN